jgi:hypothetical protein
MQHLNETLTQISILNAQTALNLQVFPLIAAATSSGLDYLTMAEAVAAGTASVEETSLSGSVPEIQLRNGAEKPILILDGEELIGAKQNRTVNITILAPAGKTTSIPVTCIEAGRWSSGDLNFEVAPRVHYSRGRAMKMASVSELKNQTACGFGQPPAPFPMFSNLTAQVSRTTFDGFASNLTRSGRFSRLTE